MDDDETRVCPYCLSEIPDIASRCRYCAADIEPPADSDTRGWWIVGFLVSFVGAIILGAAEGSGQDWGWILLGIGGVILQVGVVATAVSVGIRDAERRTYELRRMIARTLSSEE